LIKKILIIGGTGFIGYNFAKKCIKENLDVTSISRSKPSKERHLSKVKYIYTDITDKKKLYSKLNENYNYIINFGGEVDHHSKNTFKSHHIGCKNLTDFFENKKIEKFIQIGSSVEYGRLKSPHSEKFNKLKIINMDSIYAKAKLKTSRYLIALHKKRKFPVTIFRVYLAYGPGQEFNRIIPFTIKNCLKNKSFPCSDGNQFRDFIFISDVVSALFKSLKNKDSNGEIFNLCTGRPYQIKKLINLIRLKAKGGKPKFGIIKMRKDEVKNFFGNPNKIKKYLKWKPKIKLEDGLKKTIKYYANYFEKRI
jgi:UDP-glucose 4-epimerase